MKKIFTTLIFTIMCVTFLASCDSSEHEHNFTYTSAGGIGHYITASICGCNYEEGTLPHYDENNDYICDACGYAISIGGAYPFEYVASEDGHCSHMVGESCNGTCNKSPHEDLNNDMKCDMCGYEMSANTEKESNLEFKLLKDGTYEVKGVGTCTDIEIVIPSSYQNKKVTSIAYRAFAENSTITSVTIPDSIKTIDEEAFYKCTELSSIIIPESVTSLGKSAFYQCTKLVSLTIGSGIKTIPLSAFAECKALEAIVIPDGVTTIESNAFNHCESAKSVTIPKSVTEIATSAFNYTYSVENFIVAEDNTNYVAVDGALFTEDKTQLIQYPLGSTLKSFVLPDECTTITLAAMDSARYVESITFGKNLSKLELAAIINCESLKEINVHEENTNFKAIDGNLYSKDGKTLIQYALNKDSKIFTVPEGVETIGRCAIQRAHNLESISLPSTLKTIEPSAFESCTNLKSIDIPDGIEVIDYYLFAGCTALESITIPSSVVRIKFLAIAYCGNLKTINFEGTQEQWDAIEIDSQWDYEAKGYNVIYGE